MSEEAVVSKTARIMEEIGLRKEASDRVETVKDTVRREEAQVEKPPGGKSETTRTSVVSSATAPRLADRG
jgi:stress response protein YsnF